MADIFTEFKIATSWIAIKWVKNSFFLYSTCKSYKFLMGHFIYWMKVHYLNFCHHKCTQKYEILLIQLHALFSQIKSKMTSLPWMKMALVDFLSKRIHFFVHLQCSGCFCNNLFNDIFYFFKQFVGIRFKKFTSEYYFTSTFAF